MFPDLSRRLPEKSDGTSPMAAVIGCKKMQVTLGRHHISSALATNAAASVTQLG